jgi:AraC-like DNA-binding protein
VHRDSTEIEELSAFFQGWRVELIQLGPQSEETLVSCAPHRSHRILRLRAGGALVLRGVVGKTNCCAWLSPSVQAPVRFLGQELRANELMLAGAEARIDLFIPSGAQLFFLATDSPESLARRGLRICEEVTRLTRYLSGAGKKGGDLDADIAVELRQAAATGHNLRLDRVARTQGISAVVTACQVIERRFPAPITLSELSRHCGVSERTLEYGFKQVYGTTPMAFIRSQRLTRSRTALLRSAARTSISATARAYGFTHMGQYARDYRRLFGETPSRTLMRGQV